MKGVELNRKELREIEEFIKDEVEAVIFSTHRSRAKTTGYKTKGGVKTPILNGGHYIEDKTGELRRQLRSNRNFITQDAKGNLVIELEMVPHFKFLDGYDDTDRRVRKDEFSWYLREAIFESQVIRDKIREVLAKAGKRTIMKMISDATKPS